LKESRTVFFYLLFSFIAAILVVLFVLLTPRSSAPPTFLEKLGIASVFILSCCIGISFTLKPNWIRRYGSKVKNQDNSTPPHITKSFQGHHPVCPTFQNHTIQWRKQIWCAGCLGLLLGFCGAILLMILYSIMNLQFSRTTGLFLIFFGFFIFAVVLIEIQYQRKHTITHVVINSLLPLGFFLIIIAVQESTGDLLYSFFSLLFCFLWLDTRIQFSKTRHRVLCRNCAEPCKMFSESF
jgi:nitrate/nitrite transporter NarK